MIILQINTEMNGYKKGAKIPLNTDDDGNILDSFWARRLKDSVRDGCVEVVKPIEPIIEGKEKSKKGTK